MKSEMKSKQKITKDTPLAKITANPQLAEVLVEEFGLFCVGCPMAQMESLEQGALTHGMDDKQIVKLIKRLN